MIKGREILCRNHDVSSALLVYAGFGSDFAETVSEDECRFHFGGTCLLEGLCAQGVRYLPIREVFLRLPRRFLRVEGVKGMDQLVEWIESGLLRLPVVITPGFALGVLRNDGPYEDMENLLVAVKRGLDLSPTSEVFVEECR